MLEGLDINMISNTKTSNLYECVICFGPLHSKKISVMFNEDLRTCNHFLHYDCLTQLE